MIELLEKFISLLTPKTVVGGLEISDLNLRFLSVKNKASVSLRLPPGIISDGRIKDRKSLISALRSVKNKIEPRDNKKLSAVLIVPSSVVYTQTFQLPEIAKGSIESAAEFNLKMISPLRQETTYSDWQVLEENQDRIELLAAFAPAAVIDEYTAAAFSAGFKILAIEFPSIALVRLIKEAGAAVDSERPYVILNLISEGLNFMIMKNGNLYFDYFQPWKTSSNGEREIKWSDFQETVLREVRRIINYYNTRWGRVEDLILIAPEFYERLSGLITDKLGMKVRPLSLRGYGGISVPWFAALGADIRASVSRSRDDSVSLMGTKAKVEYFRDELFVLIGFWRNIISSVLGFAIIASIGALVVAGRVQGLINERWSAVSAVAVNEQELSRLETEANDFNRRLDKISQAKSDRVDWNAIVKKILQVSGPRVSIERISIPSAGQLIKISGSSVNEASAFELERNLAGQPEFEGVHLPIASVTRTVGGRWAFEITFSLKEVFFLK